MAKRGRPKFKATPKLRRTVEEMVACGESQDVIAHAIGCHPDTLREHFGQELSVGGAKRRREVIELLFKNARKGNVSAQKKLEDMTAIAAAGQPPQSDEAAAPKPTKLGKKEQAAQDAQTPDPSTSLGELMAQRSGTRTLQ